MRRDIPIREVTEVGLALIPDNLESPNAVWVAYLVNLKDHALKNILVNAEGREIVDNSRRTATMRYLIPELGPLSSHEIEAIMPEVMAINNQFWISFSYEDYLYDKKFIVPYDAPKTMPLVGIPVLHKPGLWFD